MGYEKNVLHALVTTGSLNAMRTAPTTSARKIARIVITVELPWVIAWMITAPVSLARDPAGLPGPACPAPVCPASADPASAGSAGCAAAEPVEAGSGSGPVAGVSVTASAPRVGARVGRPACRAPPGSRLHRVRADSCRCLAGRQTGRPRGRSSAGQAPL